ncbi:uncharacterized protein V6R79_022556 [Siganus canaliculatus]
MLCMCDCSLHSAMFCATGRLQRPTQKTPSDGPAPTCCLKVSKYPVKGKVTECYEQEEFSIRQCKIHAFILITDDQLFCVDPNASWLPAKLKEMEADGVFCKALVRRS